MGGSDSDSDTELKKKKEKKDKGKDKEKKDKDEKKDHGKDKHKDKDEKEKKDKDKGKDEKDKKDKGKDEKDKKDKDKDEKKDKHKDEKDKDKHKDEKKKDKEKDKDEKGKDKHKDEKKKDKEKDKDKDKDKDKKEKDKTDKDKPSYPVHVGEAAGFYNPSGAPSQPQSSQPVHPSQSGEVPWFLREPGTEPTQGQPRTVPGFPDPNPHYSSYRPPPPQPVRAVGDVGGGQPAHNFPPSGYRIPLDPNMQFPGPDKLGRPPATDVDGSTPVFIGSVIFADSVQPCKIIPSLQPPCRVPHGGSEVGHHGRYDLLPVTQHMEWVPARDGQIPPGRRPVEGGYESNASKLYHALGFIQGVYVPGKAGQHLRGASVLFGGNEHNLQENYSILCWK